MGGFNSIYGDGVLPENLPDARKVNLEDIVGPEPECGEGCCGTHHVGPLEERKARLAAVARNHEPKKEA